MTCKEQTEIYSRVCGYYRPIRSFNPGKAEEFKNRKTYFPASVKEIDDK